MHPEIGQTQAVVAEAWEAKLAEQAAARLTQNLPWKPQPRIAKELLVHLLEARKTRQNAGQDHWSDCAPACLETLARQYQAHEQARRLSVGDFIKKNRQMGLKLALAITDNLPLAEAAVADTELELLQGALWEQLYFLGVKRNALDLLDKLQSDEQTDVPLEEVFGDSDGEGDGSLNGEAGLERFERASGPASPAEMDPLDVIMREQKYSQFMRVLSGAADRASTRRRYRWVARTKWWQEFQKRSKFWDRCGTKREGSSDY